ncbi:MAG: hypothetical protein IPN29_20365 [Saprospiraceae bacterium]|nr:hypothetical protein [Saprospiraceae bacterium]
MKLWMLIFMTVIGLISASAQSEQEVRERYGSILTSLDLKDWKALDKKSEALIKSIKGDSYQDLVSIVSYMHILAISGRMNDGDLNKKDALKKARVYKGKTLIMPGRTFKENCFDCLYPKEDDPKVLFCTNSNENNTKIYSFEYYHLEEAFGTNFITDNYNKVMKIKAKLTDITAEGNMFPRFSLDFEEVTFYFMDEEEGENDEPRSIEFSDSLHTYLQYDVYVNPEGTIFKKSGEYADKKGNIVDASFIANTKSVKRNLLFKVLELNENINFQELEESTDSLILNLNGVNDDHNLEVYYPAKKVSAKDFTGYVIGIKSRKSSEVNLTFNGLMLKQGRILNAEYFVTDTAGFEINPEQEKRHYFDLLSKVEIKKNEEIIEVSGNVATLYEKMKIGINPISCSGMPYEDCIQLFVENIEPFVFKDLTADSFTDIVKHPEKGFVIPYLPGKMLNLVISDGTETINMPFKIPDLPK